MADPSWAWTAGGAISTVADMKTYVEALVEGGLLDAQMQKTRMDSIQATDPATPTAGTAWASPSLTSCTAMTDRYPAT